MEYINVLADPEKMDAMLEHSKGSRKVPVIVEQDEVSIGFKGRS